jgi:hypothetical protein
LKINILFYSCRNKEKSFSYLSVLSASRTGRDAKRWAIEPKIGAIALIKDIPPNQKLFYFFR